MRLFADQQDRPVGVDLPDAFAGGVGSQTTADDRFTLLPVCCLGNCDKAPALMIDDDTYGNIDAGGVADLLEVHGEIRRVRIEAHWDSGVAKPRAAELTQQQAEAVRTYLVSRGITSGRLIPVGVGATKPLVPNLTPMNRARNRRIELHLE